MSGRITAGSFIIFALSVLVSCEQPEDPGFAAYPSLQELLQKAWESYNAKDINSAQGYFNQVLTWQADLTEAHIGLGWTEIELTDIDAAYNSFAFARSLASSMEQLVPAWVGSGVMELINNQDSIALTWFVMADSAIDEAYQFPHRPYFTKSEIIRAEAGCMLRLGDLIAVQNTLERLIPGIVNSNSLVGFDSLTGYLWKDTLWCNINHKGLVRVDSIAWEDTTVVPKVGFEFGESQVGIASKPRPAENKPFTIWYRYVDNLGSYLAILMAEIGSWR